MAVSAEMQKRFGSVAVLFGGESAEREVSLLSGNAVLEALQRVGVDARGIDAGADVIGRLEAQSPDRVFIVLHGPGGEDGTLQGALEFLGLPYTGSGVLASAFAMDKLRCKYLWRGMGLPTAPFTVLTADTDWQRAMADLGGPAMVKPAHEGSSLGMSRADTPEQLADAWEQAAKLDSSVIAERWLNGAEYTVAILGDRVLPPIRLETDQGFYDYDAKYIRDDTRYICPCGLPPEREAALRDLSMQAFRSLGCEGWGRVDLMEDDEGNLQLLEVNTIPGMTSHSLVPMAAKAAGMSFEELVIEILAGAD